MHEKRPIRREITLFLKVSKMAKLHEKIPIRREITLFLKVSKMAIFGQIAKGRPQENFQKSPIFWSNFGKLKK